MTIPLALLLAAAPAAAVPAPTDALIDNVQGMTIRADGTVVRFHAMVIDRDGRVVRLVAPGEEAMPPPPKRAKRDRSVPPPAYAWRADLHGRVLVPGFIDSHGHVMELGFRALSLDLSATRSLAEARARIAAYLAADPDRKWIVGGGWNQETWGLGRFPTAADLDAVVADRPVWLQRADGHAAWANSAALREAGVTAKTASPLGGRIEHLANGQPSGVFVDAAKALVERVVPQPLPKERDAALLTAQAMLLKDGVTATTEMGTSLDDWLSFRRIADIGALRVRIMSYGLGVETAVRIGGKGPTPWLYADHLRMGGIKLFADGALGSRGAWLLRPYSDAADQSGAGFYTDAQLQNLMSRGAMDHWQIAVHAIGDRANRQLLDAIDTLSDTYTGDRRWRIEHAQIVDPADLPRLGKHGIVASMQPTHATSDRTMAEARLGEGRLAGAYAWASIARTGATLAFGTDYPVERPDPFATWAAAFTRTDAAGEPAGGWRPEERVTREAAWWAMTGAGAYAAFAEKRFGSLEPGQRADFVILDRDPVSATAADLRRTRVLETWIGGERVWDGGVANDDGKRPAS